MPESKKIENSLTELVERCRNHQTVIPSEGGRLTGSMIDRLNGFDPDAWNRFYETCRKFAVKVLKWRYRDNYFSDDECCEIAHNAIVKTIEAIQEFDPDYNGRKVTFLHWFDKTQLRSAITDFQRTRDVVRVPERAAYVDDEGTGLEGEDHAAGDGATSKDDDYAARRRRRRSRLRQVEFDPERHAGDGMDGELKRQLIQESKSAALELLSQSRITKRSIEAYQMYMQNIKTAEIAEELGMSTGAVDQAVSRCFKYINNRSKELQRLI